MECKRIQEYIITDYIDGQIGNDQKILIDLHLLHCHACTAYLNSVNQKVVIPFVNAPQDVPTGILWSQIRQAINEGQTRQLEAVLKPGLWERIRSAVYIPRPAFALASIVTMIFVIGSTGQLFLSSPAVHINGRDQIEYISSLLDEPVDAGGNNGSDTQTPIEKYFL
jgi:predicted anti-sigma-YlaC factor YlaD